MQRCGRRGAAHRTAGADWLTESEVVRLTMAGLDHQNRRAAVQAPALLDDAVVAILTTARLHRERGRRAWKSPGRAPGGVWWTFPRQKHPPGERA